MTIVPADPAGAGAAAMRKLPENTEKNRLGRAARGRWRRTTIVAVGGEIFVIAGAATFVAAHAAGGLGWRLRRPHTALAARGHASRAALAFERNLLSLRGPASRGRQSRPPGRTVADQRGAPEQGSHRAGAAGCLALLPRKAYDSSILVASIRQAITRGTARGRAAEDHFLSKVDPSLHGGSSE